MDLGLGKIPVKIGNPWHGLVEHLGGGSHRITLDSTDSVRTFTATDISGYALNGTWELKRPGIGSATTSPEEAAMGWEWRNWAFQPSGTQGALVFFDGAGVPWQIATSSLTINSGETVTVTLGLRPYGRLNGLTETATATVSATLSVPGITWTAGPWALMGIKRRGNVWLVGLLENWAGYPYGDHAREMKGIFEISIDGTGSFAAGSWPSGFTGFSLSASVVATTAACAPVETVITNTSSFSETPCADPPGSNTYASSASCAYKAKTTYPIWAWYINSGDDQIVDLVKVEAWYESAMSKTSTASCPSLTTLSLSGSRSWSIWHRLFTSTYSIDGPVYHHARQIIHWSLGDPPDPVTLVDTEFTDSLDGVVFQNYTVNDSVGDDYIVGSTGCVPLSFPYLARTWLIDNYAPGSGYDYKLISFGPIRKSSHVIGMIKAVADGVINYTYGYPDTGSVAISSAAWTGFLTPGGPHDGATITAGEFTYHPSSGYWQCLPAGYITAYDPVGNRHAGLTTYPAWYV